MFKLFNKKENNVKNVKVVWIDGTETFDKCDNKSICGYENDWAVDHVEIIK